MVAAAARQAAVTARLVASACCANCSGRRSAAPRAMSAQSGGNGQRPKLPRRSSSRRGRRAAPRADVEAEGRGRAALRRNDPRPPPASPSISRLGQIEAARPVLLHGGRDLGQGLGEASRTQDRGGGDPGGGVADDAAAQLGQRGGRCAPATTSPATPARSYAPARRPTARPASVEHQRRDRRSGRGRPRRRRLLSPAGAPSPPRPRPQPSPPGQPAGQSSAGAAEGRSRRRSNEWQWPASGRAAGSPGPAQQQGRQAPGDPGAAAVGRRGDDEAGPEDGMGETRSGDHRLAARACSRLNRVASSSGRARDREVDARRAASSLPLQRLDRSGDEARRGRPRFARAGRSWRTPTQLTTTSAPTRAAARRAASKPANGTSRAASPSAARWAGVKRRASASQRDARGGAGSSASAMISPEAPSTAMSNT